MLVTTSSAHCRMALRPRGAPVGMGFCAFLPLLWCTSWYVPETVGPK
jgi:hypothetical protein